MQALRCNPDVVAMAKMTLRVGLCAFLTLAATPLGARERLTLKVSPAVSFAPADLIVRTAVEADAANRGIEVEVDSGEFYESSTIELEGQSAPHTTQFEFRSLPAGSYVVGVTLLGGNGRPRGRVQQDVLVVASAASR